MAKILIVDDDLETTKLFESIVNNSGHEAFSVTESRNAVKAIEEFAPDLILLDIMMAPINGIALCKIIKSDPKTQQTPIMMVSTLSDDGTKRDALNAGADEFIVKPVVPKTFAGQINALLSKS